MTGGVLRRAVDGGGRFGRAERNGRAERKRGGAIGVDFGLGLPREMLGRKRDLPARQGTRLRPSRPDHGQQAEVLVLWIRLHYSIA